MERGKSVYAVFHSLLSIAPTREPMWKMLDRLTVRYARGLARLRLRNLKNRSHRNKVLDRRLAKLRRYYGTSGVTGLNAHTVIIDDVFGDTP